MNRTKSFLFAVCLPTGFLYSTVDYNSVATYAALTLTVLESFENTHPGCSSDAVLGYLRSKAFKHIQCDAKDMGYSWRRVLKATYSIAAIQEKRSVPILEALQKELRYQMMWRDAVYWLSLVGASFSSAVSIVSIGCFLYYLGFDRRVVNHYRHNTLGGQFPGKYTL